MKRDPVQEDGSFNFYAHIENNLPNNFDAFGLLVIPPWFIEITYWAAVAKFGHNTVCMAIKAAMIAYALHRTVYDVLLVAHYISGKGTTMRLPWEAFDTKGAQEQAFRQWFNQEINNLNWQARAAYLNCNSSISVSNHTGYRTNKPPESDIAMIHLYNTRARYVAKISKTCDKNGCCKSLNLHAKMIMTASDMTDFNASGDFKVIIGRFVVKVPNNIIHGDPCIGTSFGILGRKDVLINKSAPCP